MTKTRQDISGPSQYQQAMVLLSEAVEVGGDALRTDPALIIAVAQVHATLAVAAATCALIPEKDPQGNSNMDILNAWSGAGAL